MQKKSSRLLTPHSEIIHTFTTRMGGISKSPYESLNLGFHVGDKSKDVTDNHRLLAEEMGYELSLLVHMKQIHSDKIVIVDPSQHDFEHPPECDALLTNQNGIPLMVMVADCTPVLFYDAQKRIIGVAHAGRSGALQGIVPKTLQKMQTHFKSRLQDIQVVLGPSIGSCCYEINKEIAKEVIEKGYDVSTVVKQGRYYLNVNSIIHKQLQEIGLNKQQIEDFTVCNACEHKSYFSYRADTQRTGRFAGVMMLKP